MKFELNLTQYDWKKCQRYIRGLAFERPMAKNVLLWSNLLIWGFVALILVILKRDLVEFHFPTLQIIIVLLVGITADAVFIFKIYNSALKPKKNGILLGRYVVDISKNGVSVENKNGKCNYNWNEVKHAAVNDGFLYLVIDSIYGFCIPLDKDQSLEIQDYIK